MKKSIFFCIVLLGFVSLTLFAAADNNDTLLQGLRFRRLGPDRCGSWVTCFAVPDQPLAAHLYTFYVGTRNGGVWKTVNNGTTFTPLFDSQQRLSIGAIALAPGHPDIVWVGTGEASSARSSNSGNGVYRSTDSGKTWQHMGLADSHHIARIVVDPRDPDTVYVAAMGHLFSANAERGLFKTIDSGRSWQKILYIDEKVGVIDLVMDPRRSGVLYAATYEKERRAWTFIESGPRSAIHKSVDGGKTWRRLSNGLPQGAIGRIGLDIWLKNPDILYAIVENANPRPATAIKNTVATDLSKLSAALIGNEIFRSADGGESWKKVNADKDNVGGKAPYSFNTIRVAPDNDQNIYVLSDTLPNSTDGGKTWHDLDWPQQRLFSSMFGDVRALWIDPQNPERILLGSDGGVHISYDGGRTCDQYANLPLSEFYAVGVDMEEPYNIYGGLQDHDSWKVPSNGWSGRIGPEDWLVVGGGDGMYNQVSAQDSRFLYNNREMGQMWRLDQLTGVQTSITPKRPKEQPRYRSNWTPPIQVSAHNSQIIYTGTQVLLRSLDRGEHWEEISPDLTGNDATKTIGRNHTSYCTLTTIGESPLQAGCIWVGTDDGRVWLTQNHGHDWEEMTKKIAALGGTREYWVSRVLPSRYQKGTAYVAKTGFHFDVSKPLLFKTIDYGRSWKTIHGDLPAVNIWALAEDAKNPELLFCGTEAGLFVSFNSGGLWTMVPGVPPVWVRDVLVHARENDLIAATYGRGLYIVDITPLQEFTPAIAQSALHFFSIEAKAQLLTRELGNYKLLGDRFLHCENEPAGLVCNYWLSEKIAGKAMLTVRDAAGKVLRVLEGPLEAGLNQVVWDMYIKPDDAKDDSPWAVYSWPMAGIGEYQITLEAGGKNLTRPARISKRLGWSVGPQTRDLDQPLR